MNPKTLTPEQYQELPIEEQELYKLYRCAQSDLLPDFYALKQPIEIAPDTVEQAADEYVKEFVNYGSDVCQQRQHK